MLAAGNRFWKANRARAAAIRLFDGEQGLARYPGPAFATTADGRVLVANTAGRKFVDGFGADLAALARRAVEDRSVVSETLTDTQPAGAGLIEAIALPLDGGGGALVLGRDLTLDHQMRAALIESRQRFKDFVEIASDFAWETDACGIFIYVSPRGALGHPADALIDRPARDFIMAEDSERFAQPFVARDMVSDAEMWFRRADGTAARVGVAALPLFDGDGIWRGARGVCRDISREHAREAAMAQASERERLLAFILRTVRDEADPRRLLSAAAEATARALDALGAVIFRRDLDGELRIAAAFGASVPVALRGRLLSVLMAGGGNEVVAADLAAHRGLGVATRYRDTVNGAILLLRVDHDPSWAAHEQVLLAEVAVQIGIANEQIRDHENLDRLSRRDTLTGLLNRRAFDEALRERLGQAVRRGRPGALVYVDLDNFKVVNDRRGHAAGDEALRAVTEILNGSCRGGDLVGRLGGDEFVLWLEESDPAGAEAKARSLLEATAALASHSGTADRPLGFSMGIACFDPHSGEAVEALMARADGAMYEAKRRGKGLYHMAPGHAEPDHAVSAAIGGGPGRSAVPGGSGDGALP